MKTKAIALLLLVSSPFCFAENKTVENETKIEQVKELELVDEIKVRVNGVNITKQFLEKPQAVMGGQGLSLEAAINNELLFQRASERKLLATTAEVNKQIINLKINNGIAHLSDEELEKELLEEGLSFAEYKGQMGRFIAIERLKGAEFNERVVVTSQDIKDYFNKNQSWSEEKYLLKICELQDDSVDENGILIKKDNLKWDDLGWIKKDDLSSSMSFVSNMKKSQICKPVKIGDSYQLVEVVDRSEKFLKSLDDRYNEIEMFLQEEKRAKFGVEFEKELRADASIVYLT